MISINIITNYNNGAGLERDASLLRTAFHTLGLQTHPVHVFTDSSASKATINLFLEIPSPKFFPFASIQCIIPNPEWWYTDWDSLLPSFHFILCKTSDAFRIFSQKAPGKTRLLGFLSADKLHPTKREPSFLHLAGKSFTKNTESILTAWTKYSIPFHLYLISTRYPNPLHPNITFRYEVPEDILTTWQNTCLFHLCPSAYEGWGHYIYEALSTESIVITTDAPPMNSLGISKKFLLPVSSVEWLNSAPLYRISPESVRDAVFTVTQLDQTTLLEEGRKNRKIFLQSREIFWKQLAELIREWHSLSLSQ